VNEGKNLPTTLIVPLPFLNTTTISLNFASHSLIYLHVTYSPHYARKWNRRHFILEMPFLSPKVHPFLSIYPFFDYKILLKLKSLQKYLEIIPMLNCGRWVLIFLDFGVRIKKN